MLSRLMTVREQWLLLGVAAAIVFGGVVLIWRANTQPAPDAETFPSLPAPEARASIPTPGTTPSAPPVASPMPATPTKAPARIGAGVLGAVQNPGLYYFDEGARVQDLLEAAGGTLPDSDLADINRTAVLLDETTLLVPRVVTSGRVTYSDPPTPYNPAPYTRSAWYQLARESSAPGETMASAGTAQSRGDASVGTGLININTASQAELETLPGIGPATARKIIAHRQQQRFSSPDDLEKVSGIGPAKMAAVRDLITVE